MRTTGSLGAVRLGVFVVMMAAIAGCGGGGGGGGGSNSEVAAALGYQSAEGSASAPLAIGDLGTSEVVLYNGTVGNGTTTTGESYYLVQGATPGVDYTVTLTNLTDDADVRIFQGDPTYTTAPADRAETGNTTEAFTLAAEQDVTALYAVVDGTKTTKGAQYTLSVTPKPKSEGELGAAIDLYAIPASKPGSTVGNDPTCCEVGFNQTGDTAGTPDSYYKIDLSADQSVLVSLADLTADVDLYLSTDPDFNGAYDCFSAREGAVPEACEFTAPAVPTTLYIAVDGYYAPEGAAYTIYVTSTPYGAGKADLPCTLGAAPGIWDQNNTAGLLAANGCAHGLSDSTPPFPMSVLAGGEPGITNKSQSTAVIGSNSYYLITGLTPKGNYRLTLEEATDLVDLYVFNKDNTFSTPMCKPPYTDKKMQACTFTASGNDVYVAVDGYYSLSGAVYKLTLFPEFIPQGSSGTPQTLPVATFVPDAGTTWLSGTLTVGPDAVLGVPGQTPPATASAPVPFAAEVPAGTNGDSYFSIAVNPGEKYRVSLKAMSADVNLYVYNDATFTTPACQSFNGGLVEERCFVDATGNTLYVAVDGYFAKTGAAFKVEIREQNATGDNSATNVGKPVGGAPIKFGGKVIGGGTSGIGDTRDSYYAVYVTPGQAYRVTLTDFKGDLDLYVREGSGYPSFTGSAGTLAINCVPQVGAGVTEVCIANNDTAGGEKYLLIGVDGSKGEDKAVYSYTVVVEESKPYSAVVPVLPVTVGTEVKSAVDAGDKLKGILYDLKSLDSFYSVTVPGEGIYRIGIYKLTQDANLYVFNTDATFAKPMSTTACPNTVLGQDKSGTFYDEYCDVTVKGLPSTLYFAVDGAYTYGTGAKFLVYAQKLK